MLSTYRVNGEEFDSLDLKVLLITKGIHVPNPETYEQLASRYRISPNPLECNCLVLPGDIVAQITDVGPSSPFRLEIASDGAPCLRYEGAPITTVAFPPKTPFYRLRTSTGRPFLGMAVLQGFDVLSFPYLWSCEHALAGQACAFCHCGGFTEALAHQGKPEPPFPTPQQIAEVVCYAVATEPLAKYVQITGGSLRRPEAECELDRDMLLAINNVGAIKQSGCEISVFTSPPAAPSLVDQLFEAGADRVACDIEVWDEQLAQRICPGKARFADRERFLKTLLHIAEKYGPNKACSAFVVGIEPLESLLAGAEFLAARGIVPILSVWMPHGRPVSGMPAAPGLDYYRRVRHRIAELFDKYQIEPPGGKGFNVCVCRDTWNHRPAILAKKTG
jgi:hypothetical protein